MTSILDHAVLLSQEFLIFYGVWDLGTLGLYEYLSYFEERYSYSFIVFIFISLDVGAHVGNGKGKIFLVSWTGRPFYLLYTMFLLCIPIIAHLICPLYPFISFYVHVLFYFIFLFCPSHFCLFVSLSMGRDPAHAISLIGLPLAKMDKGIGLYD